MKSMLRIKTKVLIVLQIALILLLVINIFMVVLNAIPFGVFIIFLLYNLRSKTNRVIVDPSGVTLYNWLTVEKQQFRYEEFDQIVMHRESSGYFDREDVYLRKGGYLICKISGHNYKNLDELLNEIGQRKSLRS